jgi:hypothetical protein
MERSQASNMTTLSTSSITQNREGDWSENYTWKASWTQGSIDKERKLHPEGN